jgi:hypothetical protein
MLLQLFRMASVQVQPLSELAIRYKHPAGKNHKIIAHTGKSGLTPVYVPLHHGSLLSRHQHEYIKELEIYQRRRCMGFTVQQLVDMEAFGPYYNEWAVEGRVEGGTDFEELTSSIPIHPLFARPKWERPRVNHMGKIPVGQGRPGYFEVSSKPIDR